MHTHTHTHAHTHTHTHTHDHTHTHSQTGVVTRLERDSNTFDRTSTNGVDFFSLLGYTMVAGRFSSINRLGNSHEWVWPKYR